MIQLNLRLNRPYSRLSITSIFFWANLALFSVKWYYFREQDETVRTILVRDGTIYEETIEIRRVFVHPGFKFPSLYDDIAVAELGYTIEIGVALNF